MTSKELPHPHHETRPEESRREEHAASLAISHHSEQEGDLFTLVKDFPRQPREYAGWDLLLACFTAIGATYSDLGTSPLYVLNGIIPSTKPAPSEEDTVGIISVVFWLFTLVVMVKYGCFILSFGTLAEGGTFALYQGIFPTPAHDGQDGDDSASIGHTLSFYPGQSLAGDAGPPASSGTTGSRQRLLSSCWLKPLLAAWALWGSGLTMADGIITPAISVVSASEGIALVKPGAPVVEISLAILIALTLMQPLGAHRISFLFAPFVMMWLLFLLITGAINVASFPGILRAVDPSRAILYFVRTGNYDSVGGALLAVTGCEALFANLGQLSRRSITWPLIVLVYPSLMLAYLGQGSKLISNPGCVSSIFYLSIPGGAGSSTYYLGLALGVLATIIASQAMFTAVFSIVSQLVHMHCLPSIKQSFPSKTNPGQVFQHVTNLLLSAAIVGVVAGFRASSKLTAAYGFAVATVMLTTTVLVALQIYFVRRRPWSLSLLFLIVFGFLDGVIWAASVKKVPEGAWFSLCVGTALAIFTIWWCWCSHVLDGFDRESRKPLSSLIEFVQEPEAADGFKRPPLLLQTLNGRRVALVRMENTMAVFWKPAGGRGVPHAFTAFVSKMPAIPSLTVFLSLRVLPVAHVELHEQLLMDRHRSRPGFYGATLRLGFKDELDTPGTNLRLVDMIVSLEIDAVSLPSRKASEAARHEVEDRVRKAALICTHIWPSYYLTTKPPATALTSLKTSSDVSRLFLKPKALASTVLHLLRTFFLCALFRRMRGAFAEEEGPFDSAEEVVRVSICAQI